MLTRGGHRLIIYRETNLTAQLGQELFFNPRLEVFVDSRRIPTRFWIQSVQLRQTWVWMNRTFGVAGFRPRFDYARLSLPIGD